MTRSARKPDPQPAAAGGHADQRRRLESLLGSDDEERPSGQDLAYGQTIFTRPPVPLPRLLRRRRPRT